MGCRRNNSRIHITKITASTNWMQLGIVLVRALSCVLVCVDMDPICQAIISHELCSAFAIAIVRLRFAKSKSKTDT